MKRETPSSGPSAGSFPISRDAERRVTIIRGPVVNLVEDFAEAVRKGLTAPPGRRALPCRFLYDTEGSRLFEAICELDEYYLTRAEEQIFQDHGEEIVAALPKTRLDLVELGSGSAVKTAVLIEALIARQGALRFIPVDISESALVESTRALVESHPTLSVTAVAAEYQDGLAIIPREVDATKLVLWLGSNIGNLTREAALRFVRRVGEILDPADRFLVGVDLRKDREVLERAYDDASGVTARFSLNILARINRELDSDFDLQQFRHRAVYDEAEGRVVIALVSRCAQVVRIGALDLDVRFDADEAIHIEDSTKYSLEEIDALVTAAGFRLERRWLDAGRRFSANLMAKAAPGG